MIEALCHDPIMETLCSNLELDDIIHTACTCKAIYRKWSVNCEPLKFTIENHSILLRDDSRVTVLARSGLAACLLYTPKLLENTQSNYRVWDLFREAGVYHTYETIYDFAGRMCRIIEILYIKQNEEEEEGNIPRRPIEHECMAQLVCGIALSFHKPISLDYIRRISTLVLVEYENPCDSISILEWESAITWQAWARILSILDSEDMSNLLDVICFGCSISCVESFITSFERTLDSDRLEILSKWKMGLTITK
jgi:hypothetical protein